MSQRSVITTRKYDLLQPHFTIILVKAVEYETEYKIGNIMQCRQSKGRLKDNTATEIIVDANDFCLIIERNTTITRPFTF